MAKSAYKNKLLGREQLPKKFIMQISTSTIKYLKKLNEKTSLKNSALIYSMWHGYKEEMQDFLNEIKMLGIENFDLHVSGHADVTALKKIVEKTNPDKIELVHCSENEKLKWQKIFNIL